jgi:hypothetical protein
MPPPGRAWRPALLPTATAAALGLAGAGAGAGDGWPDADVAAFEAGLARFGKDFDDTVAEARGPPGGRSRGAGRGWCAGLRVGAGARDVPIVGAL